MITALIWFEQWFLNQNRTILKAVPWWLSQLRCHYPSELFNRILYLAKTFHYSMTFLLNKWMLSQILYRPWVPIPPWAEGTSQYSLLYGSLSSRWYWDSRSIGNVRQRPLVQRRGNWPWEASPMSLSAFHPLLYLALLYWTTIHKTKVII